MLFSLPFSDITVADIGLLSNIISQKYPYFNQDLSRSISKDFIYEQQSLLKQIRSNKNTSVTCGELVELIIEKFIISGKIKKDDNEVNNLTLKFYNLYSNGVWTRLLPSNHTIEESYLVKIKELVWVSFLNRLKKFKPTDKVKSITIFSLKNGQITLWFKQFQDYFNDQLTVYSFKDHLKYNNDAEIKKYQSNFTKSIKYVTDVFVKEETNLRKEDLEDIISKELINFTLKIRNESFELRTSLNSLLYKDVKYELMEYFRSKANKKDNQIIETISEETEFIENEDEIDLEIDRKEYLPITKRILKTCRKAERIDQYIMIDTLRNKTGGKMAEEYGMNPNAIINRRKRLMDKFRKLK